METDYKKAIEILTQQEAELQFDRFTADDAWKLGNLMVEEIRRQGIEMAVCIRKLNGHILFQYGSAGSCLNHQYWMLRKFNTVATMESSSLLATAKALNSGRTREDFAFPADQYKFCGGGFPIRTRADGLVMVATASGLAHEQDHAFLIGCLEKYLEKKVPALDMELPML